MKSKKYHDGLEAASKLSQEGASFTQLFGRYLQLPMGDYRLGWNAFLRGMNNNTRKGEM